MTEQEKISKVVATHYIDELIFRKLGAEKEFADSVAAIALRGQAEAHARHGKLNAIVEELLQNQLFITLHMLIEELVNLGARVPERLVTAVLAGLRRNGDIAQHNAFYAFCLVNGLARPTLGGGLALLKNLDFTNFSRIEHRLRNTLGPTETFVLKFAKLVSKQNYAAGLAMLKGNGSESVSTLYMNGAGNWVFVLSTHSEEAELRDIWKQVKALNELNLRLSATSDVLRAALTSKFVGLRREVILSLDQGIADEILRANPVFCRLIALSCMRDNIQSEVNDRILDQKNRILAPEEIESIRYERLKLEEENVDHRQSEAVMTHVAARRYLEIPLVVYGDEYVEALRLFFLQSVLTSKDFRELAKIYDVAVTICSTPQSIDRVQATLRPLADLEINVLGIPDYILTSEKILHRRMWFIHDRMRYVEDRKGVYVMLCPDAVFGDGIIGLINNCPEGGVAGGTLIRCSWSKMYASAKSGRLASLLTSSERNRVLMREAGSTWSHYCHRLYSENISCNYIRTIERGVLSNSWMGAPHVYKPGAGFTRAMLENSVYRYSNVFGDHIAQALDHELIGQLLEKNLLYMVESFEEFCMIEMAKDTGYTQLWKYLPTFGYGSKVPIGQIFI